MLWCWIPAAELNRRVSPLHISHNTTVRDRPLFSPPRGSVRPHCGLYFKFWPSVCRAEPSLWHGVTPCSLCGGTLHASTASGGGVAVRRSAGRSLERCRHLFPHPSLPSFTVCIFLYLLYCEDQELYFTYRMRTILLVLTTLKGC